VASIEKRGENLFRLVLEAGYDACGKRIKRSESIKANAIREAEKELVKFQAEVETGEYIVPEKVRFSPFLEVWTKNMGINILS
jgi:integrase